MFKMNKFVLCCRNKLHSIVRVRILSTTLAFKIIYVLRVRNQAYMRIMFVTSRRSSKAVLKSKVHMYMNHLPMFPCATVSWALNGARTSPAHPQQR